jgi:predicted dienelactone hydrolase
MCQWDSGCMALKQAASPANFLLRVQDVPAVLNQLEIWNAASTIPLRGRLDLKKVGMSGHSFGAVTTQAVGSETLPAVGQRFTDSRIRAAIVLSPSAPSRGNAAQAFGAVRIPLLTGGDYPPEEFASVYAEHGFGGLHYTPQDTLDPVTHAIPEAWG